ncbi:MAG: response regulator transcription factor [Hespellia sp.]|nr:response regulator transcription factor [Hespellia sp.]
MDKKSASILIVEDDLEINKLIADFLVEKDYQVTSLYDGLQVTDTLRKNDFSLVLLDLMLPYRSGDMLLAEIRNFSFVPVIIISAKETTQNKVDLLRLGADDYITKPFDMEELLARIESNLRRTYMQSSPGKRIEYDGLTIDLEKNTAYLLENELVLTAKEYTILELLMKYPDKVFSKANLFQSVWNEEYFSEDNTLNVHISNLRSKLKAVCPDRDYIDTVWGIGYRLHKAKG